MDVEKHLPEISSTLTKRRKDAVLARGEEWIEPEELERREKEAADREHEENRIFDLKKLDWLNGVYIRDLELGDLADKEEQQKTEAAKTENKALIERFKLALGDKVEDVVVSDRLFDTASCVVSKQGQMLTAQMRRMLEAAGQTVPEMKYILEINPEHKLVKKAAAAADDAGFAKWAEFIYDQALLSEQGALKDPNAFLKLMNELMN